VENPGREGGMDSFQATRSAELCPVTEYRADGTPLFTKLAFLKLMDELGLVWERGEMVELQVVSVGIPYAMESCRIPSYS
jgi:hypothetical protein